MDRLQNTDLSATPPSATSGTTGYPRVSVPGGVTASAMHPYYLYMLIEELRALIVEAGLTPAYTTLTQVRDAVTTLISDATPAASETVSGIVELATDAETVTGTSTTLATHPSGVAAAIAAELAALVVTSAMIEPLTAGSIVHYVDATSYSTTSETYVSVVDLLPIARAGTITFVFTHTVAAITGSATGYAQIYVNDVAVGTERSATQSTIGTNVTEYTENITVAQGDVISVYAKKSGDGSSAVSGISVESGVYPLSTFCAA